MRCQQAKLKSENRHTVTWIADYVKENQLVKFKNEERWWTVEKTYWPILEKVDINHDWRVGGL